MVKHGKEMWEKRTDRPLTIVESEYQSCFQCRHYIDSCKHCELHEYDFNTITDEYPDLFLCDDWQDELGNFSVIRKYNDLVKLIQMTKVYTPEADGTWATNVSLDMVQELWKNVKMPEEPEERKNLHSRIFKINKYKPPVLNTGDDES